MRDTCSPYAARERLACRHGSYGQFEPLIDALPNWDSSTPSGPVGGPRTTSTTSGTSETTNFDWVDEILISLVFLDAHEQSSSVQQEGRQHESM